MATRKFRTDASVASEARTRDAIVPLLTRHGFEVLADARTVRGTATTQIITAKRSPGQGSDRSRLVSEAPLADWWIEASCGVSFATAECPWLLEKEVIGILNPPLNIDHGTHPFRWKVKAQRAALRRACGL